MKSFMRVVATIIASTIVSLYAFELWHQVSSIIEIRSATGEDESWISRREIYLQHVLDGEDYVVFPEHGILGQDLMALAAVPNNLFVCLEHKVTEFRYDKHGFRNPAQIWMEDKWQVAIIDTSWGLGVCVEENEAIAGNLRRSWPQTANLSVAGTTPIHQYAVFREYAPTYEPDIIIWLVYEGTDFRRVEDLEIIAPLQRYLDDPDFRQGLLARPDEILRLARQSNEFPSQLKAWMLGLFPSEAGEIEELASDGLENFLRERHDEIVVLERRKRFFEQLSEHFASLVRLSHVRSRLTFRGVFGVDASRISDSTIQIVAGTLKATASEASAWGGQMVVAFIPDYPQAVSHRWRRYHAENRTRLANELDGTGIHVIDLGSRIRELDNPIESYSLGTSGGDFKGHFNEFGYRVVSEMLLEEIQRIQSGKNP